MRGGLLVVMITGIRVLPDSTDPKGTVNLMYGAHMSSWIRSIHDPEEKRRKLQLLLDNLAKQTDLRFKLERRPVEVWFVTEGQQ